MATDPQSLIDQNPCIFCYAPSEYAVELVQVQLEKQIEDNPPTPAG